MHVIMRKSASVSDAVVKWQPSDILILGRLAHRISHAVNIINGAARQQ